MDQPSADFLHAFHIAVRRMDATEIDEPYRTMIEDGADHLDTVATTDAELERRYRAKQGGRGFLTLVDRRRGHDWGESAAVITFRSPVESKEARPRFSEAQTKKQTSPALIGRS